MLVLFGLNLACAVLPAPVHHASRRQRSSGSSGSSGGSSEAQRGVTLSGLGSEQLQQMLEEDGNGMHQHLGLAEADEAEGTEGDGGSTASSRDSGAPQSPTAGLRSWLPKGRKSSRKTDEVY